MSSASKITPRDNRVIVAVIPPDEQNSVGLYIPQTAQMHTITARVMAVGPGRVGENFQTIPINIDVGDVVMLHAKHNGIEILSGQNKRIIVDADQIIATIKEE